MESKLKEMDSRLPTASKGGEAEVEVAGNKGLKKRSYASASGGKGEQVRAPTRRANPGAHAPIPCGAHAPIPYGAHAPIRPHPELAP